MQHNVSVPEDLVQIQAYLRWERKGKQMYTPEKEKVSQTLYDKHIFKDIFLWYLFKLFTFYVGLHLYKSQLNLYQILYIVGISIIL